MEAQLELARGARGGRRGERLPGPVLYERVTTGERAIRIVGGEREGQPLEIASPADGVRRGGTLPGTGKHQRVHSRQ